MATLPGPVPLPAPIEDRVEEHRHLFCSSYDVCLDRAAREDWASWTCAHCTRFRRLRCSHAEETGRRASRRRQDDAVAPPGAPRPDLRAGGVRGGGCARPAPAARHADDGWRQVSHSVESERGLLHIRLDAPSLPALFVEAARAVAEVIRGCPLETSAARVEDVAIEAPSAERLLVAWIAELLRRSVESHVRFEECDIAYVSDRQLVASVRGVRLRELRTAARPPIGHDPSLVRRPGRVTATLDV